MLEGIKRWPKREYRLADNLRTVKNTRGAESFAAAADLSWRA
jgi:hypothetical protein